jgi:hypothetical protein
MSKVVRMLVREMLTEMQAYKRVTGKKYTADIEMFRDSVGKPGYYIHLSDIPKLGVNPKTGYLPGLYLYPNTKENYEAALLGSGRGSVVAGRASRYAFLVKLRSDLKLLDTADLNEYIDRKFESIVKPILDETLDTRVMRSGENAKKYFDKNGSFNKQWSQSSVVPSLDVTPGALEEVGDDSIRRSVEKIIPLIEELHALMPLKGKQRAPIAIELNKKIHKTLRSIGIYSTLSDGVPTIDSRYRYGKEDVAGVKVSTAGTVSTTGIENAWNTLTSLIRGFIDLEKFGGEITFNPGKLDFLNQKQSGSSLGRKMYQDDMIFKGVEERLKNTAKFYYYIMRAGGPDTRASAIGDLLRYSEPPNPRSGQSGDSVGELVGKRGEPVSGRELATKILDALLVTMSRPGKQITREDLKKKNAREELNILLALGGEDFDGVVDSGVKLPGSPVIYGSLGIEGQQTFILPPIDSKLEGGGPVVMIDRLEGLAADKTPAGSVHGTAIELYQDRSPREVALSSRVGVPNDEVYRAKNAGKSISRTRERFSTARDYPKEDV